MPNCVVKGCKNQSFKDKKRDGITFHTNICVIFGVLCLSLPLGAQPSGCTEDSQCSTGFYCEIAHFCRECLSCESLKREPPAPATQGSCAKSVLDCGPCIQGLVEDLRQDRACVPPGERSGGGDGSSVPVFAWLCIGLLIMGFSAIAAYVVYRRDCNIFRERTPVVPHPRAPAQAAAPSFVPQPRAPTQPVVPQPRASAQPAVPRPSAPAQAPPPPYSFDTPPTVDSTMYTPAAPQLYPNGHTVEDDLDTPLLKCDSQIGANGAREATGHQGALPFNIPSRIRPPAPGLGRPSVEHESMDNGGMVNGFRHDDEATMDSHWMPNEPIGNNANASDSEHVTDGAGNALAPAPALACALPPATDAHERRGSDHGRRRDSDSDDASDQPASQRGDIIITVVNNISNVQLPKH